MAAAPWRCLSLCRQRAHTGEKTAQTSDSVIMMKNQPIIVMTTPNEPNAFPFAFTVAGKKKGEVALAPPRTNVASSAPGSRARKPIVRCKRKRGTQSQKTVDPRSQTGRRTSQPVSRSSAARDDGERDGAGEDEEEDREQRLVGSRSDLDPPGAGVDVLVDLADSDPPHEGANDAP